MNHEKLSPEAQAVWNELDEKTQKTIQKDNPFRHERNESIMISGQRGVKILILKEITGLSKAQLEKIVSTKKRAQRCRADKANQVLNDLKASFEDFFNSASIIINSLQEKGGKK